MTEEERSLVSELYREAKNAGMKIIALIEHVYGCDQTKADYRIDDLIEICDIEKSLKGTE